MTDQIPLPDLAEAVGDLLDRLPRTPITPETITQPIINHWYQREERYQARVAELEADLAEARRDQAQLSDHLADQNARARAVICERDALAARIAELTAEMDALRQAARAASTTPPAGAALPVIQLIPAEGCWLWECRVGDRRCHTGSIFTFARTAASVAAHHVSAHHPAPTAQEA